MFSYALEKALITPLVVFLSTSLSAFGAVIILDIDKFKYINDTYGHKTGDAVLKQLSSIIVAVFRSEDVVARLSMNYINELMLLYMKQKKAVETRGVFTRIWRSKF